MSDILYQSENLVIENSKELSISYDNFSFKKNCVTIIKGKSGIGKSTLLNILGLLNWNFLDKSKTKIQLALPDQTVSLTDLDESNSERLRKKYFSYILQEDHLVDAMSVQENILFPSYFKKNRKQVMEKLDDLLKNEFLNTIKEKLNKSSAILSGGEKKKVSLLRALLKDHEILVADEPWTSLGKDDVDNYTDFFIKQRENKSTILATHDDRIIQKFTQNYPGFVDLFVMDEEKTKQEDSSLKRIKLIHET